MIWLWHDATVLVGVLVLIGLSAVILSHLAARSHFDKTSAPAFPASLPKISILKPVEGVGGTTYDAFASFCRLDYPGEMELLIGTISPHDPIVAIAERLQKEFPDRNIRLLYAELQGSNRKTSIMETLWRSASGQLLFFSDADVFASVDYLQHLVPLLVQPGVGCVTCLPRGIQAETLGGKIIALHYGFNFLPQWMLAQHTTGIHWAVGHTMAVSRGVLEQIGGFHNFLDYLADDYELGNRVSKLNLRVALAPVLLNCAMPAETFGASFKRLLRWKRTIHRSRGPEYFGSIVTYPVFWAVILTLLHPLSGWAWGALGLVLTVRWVLAAALQRVERLPDWPRAWWLLPLVDMVEGIAFFGGFFGNKIFWAGRHYSLYKNGTLSLCPATVRTPE